MEVQDIEKYLRGFNVGYDLKKHDSEMYEKLIGAFEKQSEQKLGFDYRQGVKDGAKEYDKELMRHKIRNHHNNRKQQDHSNDNEMDRDR